MKRAWIYTLVVLLTVGISIAARQVVPEEAQLVATSLLRTQSVGGNRPLSVKDDAGSVRPLYSRDGEIILGYVYELTPQGYVVVSADTDLTPVIAYSLQSEFSWKQDEANVLLALLQADLALRMEALEQGYVPFETRARNATSWSTMSATDARGQSAESDVVIGPLLEAPTWAQNAPWNGHCPTDPTTGAQSAVGCAATALAQVLNYYRYPSSVAFSSSDSYVTLTRQIALYAADASLQEIEYGSKARHNPSDGTMGRLSLAAGVSVKMDYTSAGSGAYAIDIAVALAGGNVPITSSRGVRPRTWQYESADIRTCVNTHWGDPFYKTVDAFYLGIREDLEEGQPVILCVATAGTSTGHILICDGYETSPGRYHLNLGWGGRADGWYALPEDMPPGYNIVEYGILNIQPPVVSAPITGDSSGHDTSTVATRTAVSEVLAYPNPFAIEVTFSYTGDMTGTTMSVSVYDLSGRLVWSTEVSGGTETTWDGRDTHGERLANGLYVYVAIVADGMHTSIGRGKVFIRR